MERELFDLDILVGNWESINLNPTVKIYRNGECQQLSIIYMNETTRQACPSTYEVPYPPKLEGTGKMPFIKLKGKILYQESVVKKRLE